MSPDLSQIIEQIAEHLQTDPTGVRVIPIRHGTFERNNVWGLTAMGKRHILKQHLIAHAIGESDFSPFQIEAAVLSILHRAGCHVPQIFWKSEADAFLLLEWCGEKTLDDLAQETPIANLKLITRNALAEFCRLEMAFANCAQEIQPYIFPLDYPTFLRETMQALLDQGRQTISYLAWLSGKPMRPAQGAIIDNIWGQISNRLHGAVGSLGSLDYNARNVVIDGDKPTFIDFASVGWDWGERRLVQSFNSLGAHRPGGNFASLLDPDIASEYASWMADCRGRDCETEIAVRVDYHHLLFYLSIVYRLLRAVAQPEHGENSLLLKAWGDAKPRLQRAIDLLVTSHLSDNPHSRQIRGFIAEWRDAAIIPNA